MSFSLPVRRNQITIDKFAIDNKEQTMEQNQNINQNQNLELSDEQLDEVAGGALFMMAYTRQTAENINTVSSWFM